MTLNKTRKRKLDEAIGSNAQPHRSKSNNLLFGLGGKSYATLQAAVGLTAAGEYFYARSNQTPPGEFDGGTLQQRGATEYLVSNGKAKVLRRLQHGEYTYTTLGKRYFKEHTTSYLVNVPGRIKKPCSRSEGGERTVPHTAFMTDEALTVSATMPRQQQEAALKARVLEDIENNFDRGERGTPVLYNDSDPVLYDADGQWTLDSQTVTQNEAGQVRTTKVLDRELGATPLLPADMFLPEGLCPRATAWPSNSPLC